MVVIAFIVTLIYTILILRFVFSFDNVKIYYKTKDLAYKTRFSIIIPFRNEEEHLEKLLNSLANLNYPRTHFQVLMIDDNSTDNSLQIIERFRMDYINLDITAIPNTSFSKSPKKDAITTAIRHTTYDWIITTDADCSVSKNWLDLIDDFIQNQSPRMIVAPLTYNIDFEFLDGFQALDVLSLQSATISSFGLRNPFMCNGANLIYEKSLFNKLNGFEGNMQLASGDDIFFMEKVATHFPDKLMYLKSKDALVYSQPELSFTSLIHQRMRWAGKTSAYRNTFAKGIALSIFMMNFIIVLGYFLAVFGLFQWTVLISILLIKLIVDVLLIRKSAKLFEQLNYLKYYPLSAIFYPFFSVFIVFLSLVTKYNWKGRRFKK